MSLPKQWVSLNMDELEAAKAGFDTNGMHMSFDEAQKPHAVGATVEDLQERGWIIGDLPEEFRVALPPQQ